MKKFFRQVLQIAYEWSHEQQAKIVVIMVFFAISTILFLDLIFKMFLWNPIGPIFQIFGLKK